MKYSAVLYNMVSGKSIRSIIVFASSPAEAYEKARYEFSYELQDPDLEVYLIPIKEKQHA